MKKTQFNFVGSDYDAVYQWMHDNVGPCIWEAESGVIYARDSDNSGDICLYRYVHPANFDVACRITFVGDNPLLIHFKLRFSDHIVT